MGARWRRGPRVRAWDLVLTVAIGVTLAGCGSPPPTAASAGASASSVPSTAVVQATMVPATASSPPATATVPPATPTALPPRPAPLAPTATRPPLATATTVPTVLPVPDPAAVARGKAIFTSVGCSLCHTIQGVSTGSQGPNLTHIAAQPYDGLPNDPAFLRRWVANPQAIKPGTLMPDLGLSAEQVDDVVAYLGTLR